MKKTIAFVVLALALVAACGESGSGGGGGGSNFGTVQLAPGFTAPSAHEGQSGGSTDATTMNPSCVGNVSDTPDHLLELSGDIPNLRVFAHSDSDITLVIQRPDDTFVCNDDFDGTSPLVHEEAWPAGTYKVWVGNYNAEEGAADYKIGFSTADDASPAQLQG